MPLSWDVRLLAGIGISVKGPASDCLWPVRSLCSLPSKASVSSNAGVPSRVRILVKVLTGVGFWPVLRFRQELRPPLAFWLGF